MKPLTCKAPTSAHDGIEPRLFVHVAPRQHAVLCRGCVKVLLEMGSDWRLELRADPDRSDRRGRLQAFRDRIAASRSAPLSQVGLGADRRSESAAPSQMPREAGQSGRPSRIPCEDGRPLPRGAPLA